MATTPPPFLMGILLAKDTAQAAVLPELLALTLLRVHGWQVPPHAGTPWTPVHLDMKSSNLT